MIMCVMLSTTIAICIKIFFNQRIQSKCSQEVLRRKPLLSAHYHQVHHYHHYQNQPPNPSELHGVEIEMTVDGCECSDGGEEEDGIVTARTLAIIVMASIKTQDQRLKRKKDKQILRRISFFFSFLLFLLFFFLCVEDLRCSEETHST